MKYVRGFGGRGGKGGGGRGGLKGSPECSLEIKVCAKILGFLEYQMRKQQQQQHEFTQVYFSDICSVTEIPRFKILLCLKIIQSSSLSTSGRQTFPSTFPRLLVNYQSDFEDFD